ncbi:hypothetical protein AAY473_003289, partial [Plecturocebus cupreus]
MEVWPQEVLAFETTTLVDSGREVNTVLQYCGHSGVISYNIMQQAHPTGVTSMQEEPAASITEKQRSSRPFQQKLYTNMLGEIVCENMYHQIHCSMIALRKQVEPTTLKLLTSKMTSFTCEINTNSLTLNGPDGSHSVTQARVQWSNLDSLQPLLPQL